MEKSICNECGCKEFYSDEDNTNRCEDCGSTEIGYDESIEIGGYHGDSNAAIAFYTTLKDNK